MPAPIEPTPAIPLTGPLGWLAGGWADLRRHPLPGLLHGLAAGLFGSLLLLLAHDRFWLLAGAFSGFMLVAPVVATGLYAVSRGLEQGQRLTLAQVMAVWRPRDGRLVGFGLLLALAGTGWVLTSAALITAFAPAPIERPMDFLRVVVLASGPGLFEIWLALGAVLAAPMFASSVLTLPLLLDTRLSVWAAVLTSWRVVLAHPLPLALWGALILALTLLGMAPALLGLVVVVPWLAHASWHAYRELLPREPANPPDDTPADLPAGGAAPARHGR
jgi:uncharacterized membrane protein